MALNINDQARKEANLRLLQRTTDATICGIFGSATHVVLYEFAQASQTWEKSNVDGGLFLAVKPSSPGCTLVVVNRSSPDNYSVDVSAGFQLQHQDPFLIFRQVDETTGRMTIRGIWFPHAEERLAIFELLSRVLERLRSPAATTTTQPAPPASVAPAVLETTAGGAASAAASPSLEQGVALASLLTPLSLSGADPPPNDTANNNNGAAAAAAPTRPQHDAASAPTTTTMMPPTTQQQQQQQNQQQQQQQQQGSSSQQPLLDKKSLQLALLSLVQDDRFLDLLHAQYLKVAHARANRGGNGN